MLRDEYGAVSDPKRLSSDHPSDPKRPPSVTLCIASRPPARAGRGGPANRRVRRVHGSSSIFDSEFWTIERLTAAVALPLLGATAPWASPTPESVPTRRQVGVVFLTVNFVVLSYWLPHPHVHLPHLHLPHLPQARGPSNKE